MKLNKKDLYIGKSVWSPAYGGLVITSFSSENFITAQQPDSGRSLQVSVSSLYESPGEYLGKFQKQTPEAIGTNFVEIGQPIPQPDIFPPKHFTPSQNKVTMKSSVIKPDYYLLPHDALSEVAMVLAKSKDKYPPENWRDIPNWRHEFYSAAMRHMQNWRVGKTKDDGEGGLGTHHLANAICNLMFILDKELKGDN